MTGGAGRVGARGLLLAFLLATAVSPVGARTTDPGPVDARGPGAMATRQDPAGPRGGPGGGREGGALDYDTLTAGSVRVAHARGDGALARRILSVLTDGRPLPGMADHPPEELTVVLAPDQAAFARASGGRPPHWSAGLAIPSRGLIVLPAWPGAEARGRGMVRLVRHEWAHVALFQVSGGLRAPRWFSEGYAEYAGGWDRTRVWRLRLLLALGRAPELDSLTLRWPAGRAPAESAYLLSASVVEYLVQASGDEALAVLFDRWRELGRFDEALRRTYGLSAAQLEEDWRAWARGRYGWLLVLSQSGLAWALLAALMVLMVLLRRRHNRNRMAMLRAAEPPEAPAYWDPPSDGALGCSEGEGSRSDELEPGRPAPGPRPPLSGNTGSSSSARPTEDP